MGILETLTFGRELLVLKLILAALLGTLMAWRSVVDSNGRSFFHAHFTEDIVDCVLVKRIFLLLIRGLLDDELRVVQVLLQWLRLLRWIRWSLCRKIIWSIHKVLLEILNWIPQAQRLLNLWHPLLLFLIHIIYQLLGHRCLVCDLLRILLIFLFKFPGQLLGRRSVSRWRSFSIEIIVLVHHPLNQSLNLLEFEDLWIQEGGVLFVCVELVCNSEGWQPLFHRTHVRILSV